MVSLEKQKFQKNQFFQVGLPEYPVKGYRRGFIR